jgi:hypothetical protein
MATSYASGGEGTAQTPDRQRAELDAVLESDIFKRSPKLTRLLVYLCEKSFQGLAGEITEFAIGVDVLGREPNFDPQQDALVRVDTHHLRKRLKEYYATAGSGHDLQIVLPAGQYAPQFVRVASRTLSENKNTTAAEPSVEHPKTVTPQKPYLTKLAWIAGMAALVVLAGWLFMAAGLVRAGRGLGASPPRTPSVIGQTPIIRIAAGDREGDYTDKLGRVWMSDRNFRGGSTFRRGPARIQRTFDSELFRTGREGQFVYDIPLNPGIYELHLYFAETGMATESLRGVSMAINSVPAASIDIASDAGGVDTATVKIFKDISPAKDGILHLTFLGTGPSFLNALEVVPGIPGKMQPVRLTTRDSAFTDHLGHIWMPDESSSGGRRSTTAPIEGTADPALYQADALAILATQSRSSKAAFIQFGCILWNRGFPRPIMAAASAAVFSTSTATERPY